MKKFLAVVALCVVASTAQAEIASPTEKREVSFTWHPTSVTLGALAGAALFGGAGALIVGAVVGELTARAVKELHQTEETPIEP